MKKIILLTILSLILVSCSGLSKAGKVLRNEKIKTTDEFLIKKKEPLVLPPDYSEIPVPGSMSQSQNKEKNKLKKYLKSPKKNINTNSSSSIEETIIDRIRK